MIYTNTQGDITLTSSWNCHTTNLGGGQLVYKIVRGPTSSSASITFDVAIPQGAYIKRIWLSMTTNAPLGGAAYKMVNGHYIPPSGIVELDRDILTPSDTTYEAAFSYKSNGVVFEDYNEHTAYFYIYAPTLNVEYLAEGEEDTGIDSEPDYSNTSDNDPSDGRFFLPRLLDANLVEVDRLHPDSMSLELNLHPLSTARMHLPYTETKVKMRDFVELFAPSGSVGVYRAGSVETDYGRGQTVHLEHALTTLADSLAIGMQAMSGNVAAVFATLLECQTVKHWVLGDCDVPVDYEMVYEYTNDNLLKTLIRLYELLPEGYALEYNTRRYPFVLHIRAMPEDAFCECRLSRNLSSAVVTMEDSDLCTRVYAYGAGEGTDRITLSGLTGQEYMDADTIDAWGVVAKTFTEEDIYDAITLRDVAEIYLEAHKNPTMSVKLDAIDLYAATGEELDRFRLGRMCRLPLNQYNTIMYERVISKNYPDVYRKPDKVTITLASKIKDTSDEIADMMREATRSKLLGGSVETEEITSSTSGIYVENPYGQTFEVKEYGNLIAVRLTYSCKKSGTAEEVSCRVYVDGTLLPDSADVGGTVDILKYLEKDANGIPTVGDHTITLSPKSSTGVQHYVSTRIIIKTIEKK